MRTDKLELSRSEKTLAESIGKSIGFVGKGGMIWGSIFGVFCLFNGFDIFFFLICITAFLFGLMARNLSLKILTVFVEETPSRGAVVQVGESMKELFTMLKLGVILVFAHLIVLMIVGFVAGLA